MRANAKLIVSLIKRIEVRLPINNAGVTIESLEQDTLMQQTVAAIIELSIHKPSIIANQLALVLETISKTVQPSTTHGPHIPHDIIQSQLFVIRLLSACLQYHWSWYKKHIAKISREMNVTEEAIAAAAAVGAYNDITPPKHEDDLLLDPPPLDEALVSFLLNLMSRFLNQLHMIEEQDEAVDGLESIHEVYETAGKILYYVSASNWNSFYAKIKNSVNILVAANENSESSNSHEIRALAFTNLNVFKLQTLLTEFSPHFLNMKIHGKLLFARLLRSAIWKWIAAKPYQFSEICQSGGQTVSGSEILFDMCNMAADSSRKRATLWPLQTILIILSPNLLIQAFLDNKDLHNRRTGFPRQLRKSLESIRTQEIAATCYVDICRAASFISPNDDTILRHIAEDVEDLLREKVWDFSRSLAIEVLSSGIDQQTLISDYFLSQLRLKPTKTLSSLLPTLDERAPLMFKQSFVDACVAVASEEKTLSWHPTLKPMYRLICKPLRQIFAQTVKSETNDSKKTHLVSTLLRLFRLDPYCALMGNDNPARVEENALLVTSLTQLMSHQDQRLKCAAMDCLTQLHQASLIIHWGPSETILSNFYKISSQALLSLARQILDVTRQTEKSMKMLLNLILHLLEARHLFLLDISELSISEEIYDVPEYNQSIVTLEVSLLVSLCSPVPEICSKAIRCLGTLCKEHKIKDHGEIYHALCAEEPDLKSPHLFVGRKAQQKRVRKYLRMLTLPTPAHLLAWEEVWKRWRILTPTVLRYGTDIREDTIPLYTTSTSVKKIGGLVRSEKPKSMTRNPVPVSRMEVDDEKQTEWQHYTGFLAALGGSQLTADMEGLWDDQKKNRSVERIQIRPLLAERFVTELVEMCTSDNVVIREAVKSTLGNDLSASLYVILFRLMEDAIAQCFGANGEVLCTATNTLFVEQSVLILKMILDRLTENDWLVSVDFSTLMIHFVNYIDNLPRGNYTTMRIMIMMCHLIEVLVLKKGQTVIRDDVRVKNKLLEIIMEWTSNFNLCIVNSLGAQTNNTQNIEVQRDLDQVCMKAIVTLLSNLPLQTSEHSREGDRVSNKNRLFQKYFTFFTQLLDRCHREEADGYQTMSSLSSRSNNPVKKDSYWGPLRESVVTAISNLLSANVEAGLKSTLAMGYHEDPRTRTAFMQVLSNILNQGAQFDTLAENITLDRYEKLVELLVESDMEITLSLCDVCPAGDVADLAEVLLNAFESRNKVLPLLKAVIEKEVFSSEQESTLFRGTNMASRMLSMFSKNTCTEYVRATLQPAMETINGLPQQDLTWEMNPQTETAMKQVIRNKNNVCRVAGILLDVICKSATLAPGLFRQELAFLSDAVSKRFPDASKTQVGGFVFLRLFNPAILTPESFGLVLPNSKEVRKILLQATRLMQNLANNVMFGAKEPHLISLNDFITSNLYRVANFLREMAQPIKQESVPSVRLETLAQMKLHRYMSENLDKISRDLSLRKSHATSDTHRIIELKRTMESFSNLLGQLGPPPDTTKAKFSAMRNYALVNGNTHYNEFMRRNKHRDLDGIRALNLMYQGGVSRGGNPVFYFITRYLPQENFDYELAVYYMLRVMEPCLNRPFELVLDLTRFSEDCEMPIHWANQFFQLILNESNDYMIALHLFNPNFHLQRYIRKLPRVITNRMVKRIRFSNCTVGLSQYIAPAEIHLPKETNDVGKDIGLTVMNAFLVNSYRSLIPVQIKIGTEYLQVTTTREQEILWSLNTVLNNVYSMTDLIDIYLPPIPADKKAEEGEVHVTVNGGKSTMSLIVPNREQVYRYLLDRKRNFESNITNERHGIRPKDVPGCILNMALINLGSKDPSLRNVAYNLLCSLCVSFRLSAASQLMSAKDICVPYNDSDFIVNMSQLIASSEAHLTLEFLNECVVGFYRSSTEPERQMLTLEYIVPWLRNLTLFIYGEEATKIKELIRLLIVLTTDGSKLYEQIQRKIWKTLGEMEDIHNIMIDCLIQYSVENGAGSPQAEIVTNTIVTMSNESIRGKIIVRLRKALESTSQQAHKTVVRHPAWPKIFCLVRCMTAISFFHDGSTKTYFADCCHIVSLLVSTGPTLVRSSIHGFVINTLHQFITSNLGSTDRQKLKNLMDEVGDDKYRVHFGLNKSYANAFTITDETLTDDVGTMSLTSLEIIVRLLMDTMTYSSCTIDMANAWRARWMSLVTSVIFQNNPALQPRAFMILGCLAQDEIDDDLLFQILVILGNALARFDPNSAELCVSILMCLQNIVRNLSMNSTYLKPMFWLAVAMAQMNHSLVFSHAVRLMNTVLSTLKTHGLLDRSIEEVLMEARVPLESVFSRINTTAGLEFGRYFSFAIAGTLLKGYRFADARESIQKCLTTFLDMETKSNQSRIDGNRLGYFVGLLLFAARNDTLQELLILAGLSTSPDKDKFEAIWDVMDIPDSVLLASMLVGILDMAEGESERLFLYSFLSKASTPELFALVYELLIPKMNSIVAKSESLPLIEVVKEILITACSSPASTERANRQKIHLEAIGFSAFENFTFENPSISVTRLMSDLLRIICE